LTPSLPVDPSVQQEALYNTARMCSLPLIEIELNIEMRTHGANSSDLKIRSAVENFVAQDGVGFTRERSLQAFERTGEGRKLAEMIRRVASATHRRSDKYEAAGVSFKAMEFLHATPEGRAKLLADHRARTTREKGDGSEALGPLDGDFTYNHTGYDRGDLLYPPAASADHRTLKLARFEKSGGSDGGGASGGYSTARERLPFAHPSRASTQEERQQEEHEEQQQEEHEEQQFSIDEPGGSGSYGTGGEEPSPVRRSGEQSRYSTLAEADEPRFALSPARGGSGGRATTFEESPRRSPSGVLRGPVEPPQQRQSKRQEFLEQTEAYGGGSVILDRPPASQTYEGGTYRVVPGRASPGGGG